MQQAEQKDNDKKSKVKEVKIKVSSMKEDLKQENLITSGMDFGAANLEEQTMEWKP